MPRAKANPDPVVLTHERPDVPGVIFTIEAFRDGGYIVKREGKALFNRASQLNAFFGAPKWPSNRLQAEAIGAAKAWIDRAVKSALE